MRTSLFILTMACLASCEKQGNRGNLSGVFEEVEPVKGRSTLVFYKPGYFYQVESNSVYRDTFRYEIRGDEIELLHRGIFPSEPFVLPFHQLDENTFRIGSMFPSIPEDAPGMVTYQK